jgi:ferredoxin
VLRSVHRYAADAFVLLVFLHLFVELKKRHFGGPRAFSWISGIPLLVLIYASGIVGYWLVWDERSQFSFLATMEWLGLAARAGAAPDRLFSLFVFLHIGLPLALLAGMWIHVQRLGRPETSPPRALGWTLAAMLLVLAALRPALSQAQWDAARAPVGVAVDWFYQFIHPLMYATSPSALWVFTGGFVAVLLLLSLKKEKLVAAKVDPANCNGCGRCVADCPYNAVEIVSGKASVMAERCAACGICAGACPSSTPFRSIRELVSGIELPDLPLQELREKVRVFSGREMVFHCANQPGREGIALRCVGMLPPAFVDYALRNGAASVRAVGCADCAYRLGMALSDERFARTREPRLRATVRAERKGNEYTFTHR